MFAVGDEIVAIDDWSENDLNEQTVMPYLKNKSGTLLFKLRRKRSGGSGGGGGGFGSGAGVRAETRLGGRVGSTTNSAASERSGGGGSGVDQFASPGSNAGIGNGSDRGYYDEDDMPIDRPTEARPIAPWSTRASRLGQRSDANFSSDHDDSLDQAGGYGSRASG